MFTHWSVEGDSYFTKIRGRSTRFNMKVIRLFFSAWCICYAFSYLFALQSIICASIPIISILLTFCSAFLTNWCWAKGYFRKYRYKTNNLSHLAFYTYKSIAKIQGILEHIKRGQNGMCLIICTVLYRHCPLAHAAQSESVSAKFPLLTPFY